MPLHTPLLQVDQLNVQFQTQQELAVNNISFQLQKGEILALVGESGSGKTVTALSLMQLVQTQSASITGSALFQSPHLGEIELLTLPAKQMQKIRGRDISIVFQDPMSSLNPVISCGKQVMEMLRIHFPITQEAAYRQTVRLLEMVQLPKPEQVFKSFPHQLSGGQKQRVMIAMAMACEPAILLADEPTTALDVTVQAAILKLLHELCLGKGTSVLFISHDLGVVAQMADRILVMYQGTIVETGSVTDIFTKPQHPYTKALLACRPTLKTQVAVLPTVADFLSAQDGEARPNATLCFSTESVLAVDKVEMLPTIPKVSPGKKEHKQPLLQVEDLHVHYSANTGRFFKKKEQIPAVNGVSFHVFPGETLGIVGESGCGKTTLGRALVRLLEPTAGKILFNGKDWGNLPKEELRRSRKDFQMVFQDPYASLNPQMKIGEAIMEPMQVHQMLASNKERKQRTLALLETVGLLPDHFNRYPHEFSGGQQQRICIARALALEPTCIICDEVVSSLDVSVQAQVLNLLNRLKREFNLTLLFITHDLAVAKFMADRLLVMNKGQIVEQGSTQQLFNNPQQEYTKILLEAVPHGELTNVLAAQEKRKVYKASIDE